MKRISQFLVSVFGCEVVGVVGGLTTAPAISSWYALLVKPPFAPPDWLFGPVWTMLYFMMGIAWFLVWRLGWQKKKVRVAGWYFLAQLGCNFLWSLVFFGMRSPLLGLFDILIMWALIVFTIRRFYPLSKVAAYLLVPYLLWVSFATLLNAAIVVLN